MLQNDAIWPRVLQFCYTRKVYSLEAMIDGGGNIGDRFLEKTMRLALRTTARVIHKLDDRHREPQDSLEANSNPEPEPLSWRPINQRLDKLGVSSPIEGAPKVELERPLVMVPGYRSKADCFDSMANTLIQDGQNGGRWYLLEDGAVFDSENLDQSLLVIPENARVFVTRFEGNVEAPDQAAGTLSGYIGQVTEATGQEKVDVQGYSMGGLISRGHLDQQDDPKVGKLMQVGTPNQGSELARLATLYLEERPDEFGEVGSFEKNMVDGNDHAAASWLQPVGEANPRLQELNSRWETQREKLEGFLVVGSDSKRTLGPNLSLERGDGIVHAQSLNLPGEQPVMLDPELRLAHGELMHSPQVFQEAQSFFGWRLADPAVQVPSEPLVPEPAERPHQPRLF